MKVLLTGSFGNIGTSTLKSLVKQGHSVTCFDIKNAKNVKIQKNLLKKYDFQTFWGDICNADDIYRAIENIDSIIHLAAIIAPLSEKNPDLSYRVNVIGTKNIIELAKRVENRPNLIFASSISIFGSTMELPPPRKATDRVVASDHYTGHKIECEKLVKESGLNWLILRITATMPLKIALKIDPIIFEIPLEQRIEFLYTGDAGNAFANSINLRERQKILLIGGGERCQIYQKDFLHKTFHSMGLKMLPDSAFKKVVKNSDWFYTDWLDTKESQDLLCYQNHSFEDYLKKIRITFAGRRMALKILNPLVKMTLIILSPYYKVNKNSNDKG